MADGVPGPAGARAERLWALLDAAVVLSGTLDLERVLKRLVRIACRVVGARYGALGVLNEEGTGLSNFVYWGISRRDAERIGPLPEGRGLLGAVITDAKPIRLDDVSDDPRSSGFPAHHPPMRSFLGVPVIARDRVFGNLYLTEKRGGGGFTDEDEDIALALARQAGVAVENARLYQEVRTSERIAHRRVEELTSIQEMGSALLTELDPDRVLRMIADRARRLLRAHSAAIAMASAAADSLTLEVVVGRGARSAQGMRFPTANSRSGEVLHTGEAALIDDLTVDERVHYPIVRALEARSGMFATLIDRGERIGVLAVTHGKPGHFDEADLLSHVAFANLASLAIRNARLFAAERERMAAEAEIATLRVREEMRLELLQQVINAQEEERRRIARDLHDSAGQALASILLGLKIAGREETLPQIRARLGDLREVASDAAGELRRIALELRPTVLDDLGLRAALERYVRDFEGRTGIRTRLRLNVNGERLPPDIETVVYRIAQEALTNTAKYAGAGTVRVDFSRSNGKLRLRVRDDGTGFDATEAEGVGLGLQGMRERAGLVGGAVEIRSAPGRGTTVLLEIPEADGDAEEEARS